MDKISILENIINKNIKLFNEYLNDQDFQKLKPYYDEIYKKSLLPNKGDFANINTSKLFLIIFYFLNYKNYSFDDLSSYVNKYKKTIDTWNYNRIKEDMFILLKNCDKEGYLVDSKYLVNLKNIGLSNEFLSFSMSTIYNYISLFLQFRYIVNTININKTLTNRDKIISINKMYEKCKLKEFVTLLENIMSGEKNRLKDLQKLIRTKMKYTDEVISKIKDGSILNLKEISLEWNTYLESDLLNELYKITEENIIKEHDELLNENKDLSSKINRSSVTKFLFAKGFNPYSLPEDKLLLLEELSTQIGMELFINNLSFLEYLGLSLYDIIFNYSNLISDLKEDVIDRIKFLIDNKFITKKTLIDNMNFLDERFNELNTNYEILKPLIDPNNIFYNDSIMFKSLKTIKNILSILAEYHLSKNNYLFLICNFNFIFIYDLMIEKNIPLNLFISICETPNPLNTIKRILIYNEIGEEFVTNGNILRKDVTSESKFLIPDSLLDEHLPNFISFLPVNKINGNSISNVKNNDLVKKYDEKYLVNDYYVINNIVISRPKFLRNFEKVNYDENQILSCLIANSILNEKEYYDIVKDLKIQSSLKL